jgi:hypothetical protein
MMENEKGKMKIELESMNERQRQLDCGQKTR